MTPNERSVYESYAAQFAARSDAFAGWVQSGQWVCHREALTAEVIAAGFAGGPSVSGYTINPDNRTHVACIDFDSEDGLALARQLRATMAHRDVQGYVEASRRGSHLWVLLDHELPARTVRRALKAFLRDAGITETPKVELRPSHDEIKPDGYGSPIRMPTMPHPKTGLRYPVLDADDKPLSPRIDQLLLAMEWSPSWAFEAMSDTLRPRVADLPPDYFPPRTIRPDDDGSASAILMALWGAPRATPGRTIKCPAHSDETPSLSISADDKRAWCHAPHCDLCNDGRGRGTHELTVMAPKRGE